MPCAVDHSVSFAPTPFMYRVEFIMYALTSAGLGGPLAGTRLAARYDGLFRNCWKISAAPPAAAGVEWLVPDDAVYQFCPAGNGMLMPTPPQTPSPR